MQSPNSEEVTQSIQIELPSLSKSYNLKVAEWTDTKLVLSNKNEMRKIILLLSLSPFVLLPIMLIISLLDGATNAQTWGFLGFFTLATIGFTGVFTTLIVFFIPYWIFEFDAAQDEINMRKNRFFIGLIKEEKYVFSDLQSITTQEHEMYFKRNIKLYAVIMLFSQKLRILQTIDSVEETKKHVAWIAEKMFEKQNTAQKKADFAVDWE